MGQHIQSQKEAGLPEINTEELESTLDRLLEIKGDQSREPEINKLRRLVLGIKKKYTQTLQELALKGKGEGEEAEGIKKIIKELRQENASLIAQQRSLLELLGKDNEGESHRPSAVQEDIESLQEQSRVQKHRIEKLMKVVHERERRIAELQSYEFSFKKVSEANQQYEKEVKDLRETVARLTDKNANAERQLEETHEHATQLERAVGHLREKTEEVELDSQSLRQAYSDTLAHAEVLKEEIRELKSSCEEVETSLADVKEEKDDFENELRLLTEQIVEAGKINKTLEDKICQLGIALENKKHLEEDLAGLRKQNAGLQQELDSMKQTLVKGLREAKDIKQYYHTLANEKSAAIQKTANMQQHIKELLEKIKVQDRELDEARRQVELERQERLEVAKKWRSEKEKQHKNEQEIMDREESLASLSEQIKAMQKKLKNMEDSRKEKDSSVVEAQQQFAKKALEVSQLSEKNEEYKTRIAKLQEDLVESKSRITEAQAAVETSIQQQKKLQDQLSVWEQKYYRIYERLQETEIQNKELKKVEEKHQQMQQLLSNLGTMIGSPIGISQPHRLVPEGNKAPEAMMEIPKEMEHTPEPSSEKKMTIEEGQSLFDPKKPKKNVKKDLFDS